MSKVRGPPSSRAKGKLRACVLGRKRGPEKTSSVLLRREQGQDDGTCWGRGRGG